MSFGRKTILVCICLGAVCFASAQSQQPSAGHESKVIQTQAVAEAETGSEESTEDQGGDWLEAHESNGPEGTGGVPMQRMSRSQLGLVLVIMAAGGGLATLIKPERQGRP